ncbi:MAG: CPBP family intramembrane metalloprotease [Erysipelotrichaceae bacterium]|nr:CPBP family intramembrane metalloprotease [Erysipelotrichaceae bacterium]
MLEYFVSPKKVFNRMGFAQIVMTLASGVAGLVLLTPFRNQELVKELFLKYGASPLFLLMYLPNVIGAVVFWLCVRNMPRWKGEEEHFGFWNIIQVFTMMYFVSLILNTIGLEVSEAAPAGGSQQLNLIGDLVTSGTLAGLLIPTAIGPLIEEIVFRKLMINRTRIFGEKTAIVFSAICFGLFHGNLTQCLFAFSVGLFLGYVYCRTGKMWITYIMHALLNGLSSVILLVLPLIQGDAPKDSALILLAGLALLVAVLMIAGLINLIRWILKKRFFCPETPREIPSGSVFSTVYLNLGVILLFVLSIGKIVIELMDIKIKLPF